jgi:hypothetical protein
MMPTMFELSEEHRMLQDLVAKFIDRDVMPLEKAVLAREMSGQKSALNAEEEERCSASAASLGCGDWTCRKNSAAPTCRPLL